MMNADNRSTLDLARCVIVDEPDIYLNPFRDLIVALAKEQDQQKCLKQIEDLVVAESQGRSLRPEAGGETTKIEELPTEVSTAEAARILGVSKNTVLKLKAAGLLEYRNMAPPDSSRPVYAYSPFGPCWSCGPATKEMNARPVCRGSLKGVECCHGARNTSTSSWKTNPPFSASLIESVLCFSQMFIPKMAVDMLNHGNRRSSHAGDRTYFVPGHEHFGNPQISEAVDGDFISNLPDLQRFRNFLDSFKSLRQHRAGPGATVAVQEHLVGFLLSGTMLLENSQGFGVQGNVPNRRRPLSFRPLMLSQDDLLCPKQHVAHCTSCQFASPGSGVVVTFQHISEPGVGVLGPGGLRPKSVKLIEVNEGGGKQCLDFRVRNQIVLGKNLWRDVGAFDTGERAIDRGKVGSRGRKFCGPIPAVLDRRFGMAASLSAQMKILVEMLQPHFEVSAFHLVCRKIGDPGLLAAHPEVEEPIPMRSSGLICVLAAVLFDPDQEQFDKITRSQTLLLAVLLPLR
jgi:hypothetical protein